VIKRTFSSVKPIKQTFNVDKIEKTATILLQLDFALSPDR
jgi:hypothetical protein